MRMLTFSEARQVEQLRAKANDIRQYHKGNIHETIVVTPDNADFWLNLFDMALQTNEALSIAWRNSSNPRTDIVELVRAALND